MCEESNTNIEKIDINELDILGRDEFVYNCRVLIDAIFETTKSSFIMIDGEWGVGKTFVMNMLDKDLKDEYTVIKYNCWENSYYNDPLEAILSVMLDYIDKNSLWSNANKEKFKVLGKVALNLLTLGSVEILNKVADKTEEYINSNDNNIYTTIQEIKRYIRLNKEPMIILVDEIDRCLPEYAIKTLERLYLLFKDVPNIVVIVANDKSKLEKIIKNTFGYDVIDNYLEKFIDYTLTLEQSFLLGFFDSEKFKKKYFYYLNRFNLHDEYITLCQMLFTEKEIRHIDKTIKKAYKLHVLSFGNCRPSDDILMAELLIVELKKDSLTLGLDIHNIRDKYSNLYTLLYYNYMLRHLNGDMLYYDYMLESPYTIDYDIENIKSPKLLSKYVYNCLWYLVHIAKSFDNTLDLGSYNYKIKDFEKIYLEKLELFYCLSMDIL